MSVFLARRGGYEHKRRRFGGNIKKWWQFEKSKGSIESTHRNILMRLGRHDNDFEARAEEDDNRTQMINAFWEMNGQTNIEMAGRSDVIQFWIRYLADKGPREMDPFSMEI
jgi:hypothetical protein